MRSFHRVRVVRLVAAIILALLGLSFGPTTRAVGADGYPSSGAADCSKQFGTYAWCVDSSGDGVFQAFEQYSSRKFNYRNCTDFVAWKVGLTWSGIQSGGSANAINWRQGAIDRGYKHSTTAVAGATAWWGTSKGTYGHVAYVTSVNADGTANIEQYNALGKGTYSTANNVRADDYLYINTPTAQPASTGRTSKGNQFLADVTGDGRADAVIFFANTGEWYVAPSQGSSFGGYSRWTNGHGVGSANQFLADVTGDGRADAVIFIANTGEWYVAPSQGSSFGGYSRWTNGHGVGSQRQLLEDVTGDGRADAVIFIANTGEWYVAPSQGSSFGGYSRWINGHGVGSY